MKHCAGFERCFYCDAYLSARHEDDHLLPERISKDSKATVCACINCHDLVDRVPLDRWSADYAMSGIAGVLAAVPHGAPRILLSKFFKVCMDAGFVAGEESVRAAS